MKKIKTIVACFSILLLFVHCSKDSDKDEETLETIDSEYSVYSAILNQGFENLKKPLIVQQTSDLNTSFSLQGDVYEVRIEPEGIEREVFDDLLLKNDTIYELENKFDIAPREAQLITDTELQAIFSDSALSGWDEFYKEFPDSGGFMRFSRVGFNSDGTEALVEYAYIFGGLGAEGGFVYLQRENQQWSLKKFVLVWLS